MGEMPFQPPSSVSMHRQPEPHSPPVSAGTFFLPTSTTASSSYSSLTYTLLTFLHAAVIFHCSLPDLYLCTMLSCLALASLIHPAFSRRKNNGWENPTSGGEQLDQQLQELAEAIKSLKLLLLV